MMVCLFIFSAFSLLNITGVLAEDVLFVLNFEDYFHYEDGNYVLTDDIVVNSSFRIDGDTIVLNGHSMTVEGDLCIDNGSLNLDSGSLTVKGDFFIGGFDTSKPAVLDINNGNLIVEGNFETHGEVVIHMVQENDFILVHGNFSFVSSIPHDEYLINGTLEVKGDFNDFSEGNFLPSLNHRVVLSGDNFQNVSFNYHTISTFNILELNNSSDEGVTFNMALKLSQLILNNTIVSDLMIYDSCLSLQEDWSINDHFSLCNSYLDLNEHSLKVNGDFFIDGFDTSNPAILDINNGKLIVEGNFDIHSDAILNMCQDNDFVLVQKELLFNSYLPHSDYLINGILEIKGDFHDFSEGNFLPSLNHRVVLSGEDVQYVTFEYPEFSSFNILELTKPLETGYVFSYTPVWNTLIEPGTSFKLGDLDGNGTINSTDAAILKRYILGIIDEIPAGNDAADLNGDGNINSLDYTILKRFILDIITEFPVNQ